MVLPQYAFIANEISHDEVRKPEVLTNNDFLIISSSVARIRRETGLQQIATLRRSLKSDVSRSIDAVFVVPESNNVHTLDDLRVIGPQPRRHGPSKAGSFRRAKSHASDTIPNASFGRSPSPNGTFPTFSCSSPPA